MPSQHRFLHFQHWHSTHESLANTPDRQLPELHQHQPITLNPLFLRDSLENLPLLSQPYNITFQSFDLITLTSFITYAHFIMAIKIHTIKAYLSGISFFSKPITGSSITSLLKDSYVKSQLKPSSSSSYCRLAVILPPHHAFPFMALLKLPEPWKFLLDFCLPHMLHIHYLYHSPRLSRHACISDLSRSSDDTTVFYKVN